MNKESFLPIVASKIQTERPSVLPLLKDILEGLFSINT